MPRPDTPIRVAVVAFDRISAFHLAVPCVVFGEALPEPAPFEVVVCATERGPLRTSAGFRLSHLASLAALETAEVVIVPSWRDVAERPPQRLLHALRAADARGAQLVGLCLGAYVLAAAGLLDGRRATTHWAYADDMARRFPAVRVEPEVLYVEDGATEERPGVLTSAGTAAGLDACLHLLRRRLGAEAANRAARRLVVPAHRAGGQAQYIEQPVPRTLGDARLAHCLAEARARLGDAHSLDSLAAAACMSRRSFTRHFRAHTGTTVQVWLLAEHLTYAQRLLEGSAHPIERVAEIAGFGAPATLRHHFRRAFGVTPGAWRRTFAPA